MTSFYRTEKNNIHHRLTSRLLKALLPLFTLSTVIFSSCTQDPVNIGIALLPDDDFVSIYSTDTIGIKAYTMYDSLAINRDSTKMIAGGIYDPYFGSTHCDFITQLRLMDQWRYRIFTVDSVFLNFIPSNVSGDTAAVHYIRLYETGTKLTSSTDYSISQNPDTIEFLGEYPMPVLKADSSYSVRISNAVGEYLLRDTTKLFPPADFYTEFFKGLYFGIRSETNPVLITLGASDDPYTTAAEDQSLAIAVFYHDTADYDYTYYFSTTGRAINYNRFTHDRSTAQSDKEIKHVNDFVTDTAVYLQTYQGVFARLDLPSLMTYKEMDRIAVNKARLHVPVHYDELTYFEDDMPAHIYLVYRNAEGKEVAVPDLSHDVSFMDGTYYKDEHCYVFNIATFVQQYLEGTILNPSVEMYFPLSATNNVIFKANGNDQSVRFEFAYTIY